MYGRGCGAGPLPLFNMHNPTGARTPLVHVQAWVVCGALRRGLYRADCTAWTVPRATRGLGSLWCLAARWQCRPPSRPLSAQQATLRPAGHSPPSRPLSAQQATLRPAGHPPPSRPLSAQQATLRTAGHPPPRPP
eukprot:365887-Chlamydomonas_euryale.AAC.2